MYDTGIRPLIDNHLKELSEQKRDYGDYWSASSAGYCMRKQIFERLGVPPVLEDARKQRVFSSGHIFHEWIQKITRDSGLSIAQEVELQDDILKIRGHIDDLLLINKHLILEDYKTAHSKWFEYAKNRPPSYYNVMQVGTYMYMVRKTPEMVVPDGMDGIDIFEALANLSEARLLKISKDDLRLHEFQVLWTPALEKEVKDYWFTLNNLWNIYNDLEELPECTCHEHENGFLAKEKYNPFFYNGSPCSLDWFLLNKKERVAN